jgi:hypothetical protein
MTSVRAQQLVPVLERGAMTIDADLSLEEADRLFDRLASLGVPAQIVDGDGAAVRDAEDDTPGPDSSGESVEQPKPTEQNPGKILLEVEEADGELLEPEEGWESFLGDVELEEVDVPAPAAPGEVEPEKRGPDPDRVASQFGAEPLQHPTQNADQSLELDQEKAPPPQIPSRGVDGDAEMTSEPTGRERQTRPDSSAENGAGVPSGRMSEPGFDAGRMNAALDTESDRPPFEPEGFDDRNEHVPALAAVLSLLAPGAGQTYNGQPEQSWGFGIRFALLVPWYRSVRQAWERAEKIRTYHAPRPREGSFLRALKYVASWWIIVGGAVALLGFGGYAGYNALTRPERPKITEADIQSAHDEARRQIRLARIGGLDGVSHYLDERDESGGRFTMSEQERVERLFRRGYQSCESGEYSTCEAVMKRVSSLSPKYRREAYKLQAWASMQRSPDSPDQPMPRVEIDSLETFETRESNPENAEPDDAGSPPEPPGEGEGTQRTAGSPELDPPEDSEDVP